MATLAPTTVHTRARRDDAIGGDGDPMSLPPFPEGRVMRDTPTVCVVVNNHNYGSYVGAAIDSALAQTYPLVEVIVVDDGSDDGSRAVIESYGERIHAVFQPNQGQKAAFNSGLAACTADIVIFLDADDELDDDTAARVVDAFTANPSVVRVVYRLRVIDAAGRDTGARIPSTSSRFPKGDVRPRLLTFPDDLAWPPTSGNAFAAWVLEELFPLPVDDDRTGADQSLHTLVPLFGPVDALEGIGGAYRVHGSNDHARRGVDIAVTRRVLRWTAQTHAALAVRAAMLGYPTPEPRSVTLAAHRLVSLRLGDAGHPVAGDTRWRAWRAGRQAARGRWDVTRRRRIAYAAWFTIGVLAPKSILQRLAERRFQSTPAPGSQ